MAITENLENRSSGRRRRLGWGGSILPALLASMALTGIATQSAGAASQVTTIGGLSYNYYTKVSLFGGPSAQRGYGQTTCVSSSTPAGCVAPSDAPSSASPSVTCPAGGGTTSVTDPDGARGVYGPAVIFGGEWPATNSEGPPSGPLTASIDCQLGLNGHVTASTDVVLAPPGSTWTVPGSGATESWPGGVGPAPFHADEVHSTCTTTATATTASTTIVNGVVETSTDPVTGDPVTTVSIPTTPPAGYTVNGTINHVGDSFRIVFNEQTVGADGSITVDAEHMYLLGPTAVGDMVVGSSTCGPVRTIQSTLGL